MGKADADAYPALILTLRTQCAMLGLERGTLMVKHMSSREARANFADLLGAVYYTGEAVVVEKKGKAVAVVINPATYQALTEAAARDWVVIEEMQARNADRDPDAVLADVTAAVEEVRAERHERA